QCRDDAVDGLAVTAIGHALAAAAQGAVADLGDDDLGDRPAAARDDKRLRQRPAVAADVQPRGDDGMRHHRRSTMVATPPRTGSTQGRPNASAVCFSRLSAVEASSAEVLMLIPAQRISGLVSLPAATLASMQSCRLGS